MVEILRDGDAAVDLLSETPNPVMVKDDVGGSVLLEVRAWARACMLARPRACAVLIRRHFSV